MATNPVRPGHAPAGHARGVHGATGPTENEVPAQHGPGNPIAFDFVLRGYDRNQVDKRVAELLGQLSAVNQQLRSISAQLSEQRRRADQSERELRTARNASAPPDDEQGFGYRAERLLRMAEAEANDIRGAAIKEAATIVERARAAAEAHRHEIEQNLIMRATSLDQKANEVAAALREREETAAAELAAARNEADSVRATARQEMEQARKNLETVAQDVRQQAERWAEQHRADAIAEVSRLSTLRDTLRHELSTVSASLLSAVRAEERKPPGHQPSGPPAPTP